MFDYILATKYILIFNLYFKNMGDEGVREQSGRNSLTLFLKILNENFFWNGV